MKPLTSYLGLPTGHWYHHFTTPAQLTVSGLIPQRKREDERRDVKDKGNALKWILETMNVRKCLLSYQKNELIQSSNQIHSVPGFSAYYKIQVICQISMLIIFNSQMNWIPNSATLQWSKRTKWFTSLKRTKLISFMMFSVRNCLSNSMT